MAAAVKARWRPRARGARSASEDGATSLALRAPRPRRRDNERSPRHKSWASRSFQTIPGSERGRGQLDHARSRAGDRGQLVSDGRVGRANLLDVRHGLRGDRSRHRGVRRNHGRRAARARGASGAAPAVAGRTLVTQAAQVLLGLVQAVARLPTDRHAAVVANRLDLAARRLLAGEAARLRAGGSTSWGARLLTDRSA